MSYFQVAKLSAITANIGNLTIDSTGSIITTGATYGGSGVFLGYNTTTTSAYKFSVGSGTATNTLTWDGTTLKVPAATVTGTLTASQIAANAITASKISVGDFTNLVKNPAFDGGSSDGWTLTATSSILAKSATEVPANAPSEYVVKNPVVAGTNNDCAVTQSFDVRPGEVYYVEWYAASGTTTTGSTRIFLLIADQTNTQFTYPSAASIAASSSSPWTKYSGQITIPATITGSYIPAKATIAFGTLGGTTNTGTWYVTKIVVRRAATSELIVDGAITAAKLSVTNLSSINSDLGTVTAGSISGSSLTIKSRNLLGCGGLEKQSGWSAIVGSVSYTTTLSGGGAITTSVLSYSWSTAVTPKFGTWSTLPYASMPVYTVGTTYTVSFYAKLGGNYSGGFIISDTGNPSHTVTTVTNPTISSTSWQRYVYTIVYNSALVTYPYLVITGTTTTGSVGTIYFSNFQVEQGSAVTDWVAGGTPVIYSTGVMNGSGAVLNTDGTFAIGNAASSIVNTATSGIVVNGPVVFTENITNNGTSVAAVNTSTGASVSVTVSVPSGASAVLLDWYLGPPTQTAGTTYGGGKDAVYTSGYINGPILVSLTDNTVACSAIVISPNNTTAAVSHTYTVTRSYYTGTMRLSVLILKR